MAAGTNSLWQLVPDLVPPQKIPTEGKFFLASSTKYPRFTTLNYSLTNGLDLLFGGQEVLLLSTSTD
jgi:hypothetical protein